ncbi:MAG: hypothetical protein GWM98_11675 [Nitrospinaceae bacterium]|nr:hypothetical protein [Nitrospinaceae bacterium]NIR55043.1 hypothetical protein [Nitrospinaceae bacterium]NIS85442.1 hypothetical protein [Nitrospinaceae bacterium]NIT82281.1 hypothetical protein [Nitrospinaceae bacterium]NIU44512.1 hypothetical protein [Nitrospinaceae bacterium]
MKNDKILITQTKKLEELAEAVEVIHEGIGKAVELIREAANDIDIWGGEQADSLIQQAISKIDTHFEDEIAGLQLVQEALEDADNDEEPDPCPGYPVGR